MLPKGLAYRSALAILILVSETNRQNGGPIEGKAMRANIACNAYKSAATLIAMSEELDTIIDAPYSSTVAADLLADSDDTADTTDEDGDRLVEYWGATWRVHLHGG